MSESNPNSPFPVVVHQDMTAPAIQAAGRMVIIGLGTLATGFGIAGAESAQEQALAVLPAVASAVAFAWGLYATIKINKKARIMANQLPNAKAVAK